jgi:hypothetical protein
MGVKEVLAFGSLTAGCVFLAIRGEPFGWWGLLVFGGGGAVYWLSTRASTPSVGAAARHGLLSGAESHTSAPRGVVFRTHRSALAVGAAGAAIFVATGWWLIGASRAAIRAGERVGSRSPELGLVVGAACVLFFGALLLYLVAALVRPGGLALLREGVWCRQPGGSWWLPWDEISKVSVVGVMGQRFVGLRARSAGAVKAAGVSGWTRGWNRGRLKIDVTFLPRGTVSADRAVEAIQRYLDDPEARERLGDPAEAERWNPPGTSSGAG